MLILNFGEKEEQYCLPLLLRLRREGVNTELYPDAARIKKQMSHADAYGIPFVVLAGEDEINSGLFTLKNMQTGEQQKLTADALVKAVKD